MPTYRKGILMETATLKLPSLTPLGSLDSYLRAVGTEPMLTAEEEFQLATALREDNDLDAARQLVMSHLRFVAKIARGYKGYGLPQADLIQEGNIGLMKAVKRFDPAVGVRLVSFAVYWIKAEIHEFVLRNWRIVKVATTKPQRKLFFNLRKAKKELKWLKQDEAVDIANALNVSTKEVLEMEKRLHAHDASFDPAADADGDETFTPAAYLQDNRFEPSAQVEKDQLDQRKSENLADALSELDDRSRDIVQRRWLQEPKATLHVLAEEYQVSAERIRQIEKQAFSKLKGFITLD